MVDIDLTPFFVFLVIVGIIVGATVYWIMDKDEIRVREKLTPYKIELTLEDNIIDTLYKKREIHLCKSF